MGNTSNCTSPDSGKEGVESFVFLAALPVLSVLILIILSFTQRRKRLATNCLRGYFALPIPMDFVIAPKYRLIYIITFGVMASNLVLFYFNLGSPSLSNVYLKVFYKILFEPLILICLVSLTFLPLFMCADTPIPLLGHSLGFLYSALLLANILRQDAEAFVYAQCTAREQLHINTLLAFAVLKRIPVYFCFAYIFGWYLFKTATGVIRRLCMSITTDHGRYTVLFNEGSTGIKKHHAAHVVSLLHRRVVIPSERRWFIKAVNYLFPYQWSSKQFRFPVPFLGAITAMAMLMYQLTFPIVTTMLTFVIEVAPLYDKLRSQVNLTGALADFLGAIIIGLPVIAIIAPFLSLLLCIILLVHMTACVHKQLVTVARHGFTDEQLSSPAVQLAASWKFLGSLVGYFTCAWLIYAILIAVFAIVMTVLGFGFKYFQTYTVNALVVLIIPAGVIRLVYFAQTLMCKYVFLDDRTEGGKFIPITNRRLFNWFHYILFFYNGFAGFVGAIFRAALGTVFGLLLLFRLDRIIMMKDFAWLDFGHKAYIGFLYVYSNYNNHVVHTFVHLLKDSTNNSELGGNSKRARTRWLVAYTLIRNPQLQPLTASRLQEGRETDTPLSSDPMSAGASVHISGNEMRSVLQHNLDLEGAIA